MCSSGLNKQYCPARPFNLSGSVGVDWIFALGTATFLNLYLTLYVAIKIIL